MGRYFFFKISIIFLFGIGLVVHGQENKDKTSSPQWQPASGYKVEEFIGNLQLPVGISFFPPQHRDKQIMRFMFADLKGDIKGVTHAGKLVHFTQDETIYQARKNLPDQEGESGQTGLCIAADGKTVFTTGVTTVDTWRLNKITKWRITEANKISKIKEIIFSDSKSSAAHQIGYCKITTGNMILVGIGDAYQYKKIRDVTKSVGKILRLTLDLTAPEDNPFLDPQSPDTVAAKVYATGFRNPFAIAETPDGVFVADNGTYMDRLLKLEKGRYYRWNGKNVSFTYGNILMWPRGIGPADMIYIPPDNPSFPRLRGHLLVLASHKTRLIAVPISAQGVTGDPITVLRRSKKDKEKQSFAALALGDDGIYISHFYRRQLEGMPPPGRILKFSPAQSHKVETIVQGDHLFDTYQCRGCHQIRGQGSEQAVALDDINTVLKARLRSENYLRSLPKVWRTKLTTTDLKQAVRLWLTEKLTDPKFADSQAIMPQANLKPREVEALVTELMQNYE